MRLRKSYFCSVGIFDHILGLFSLKTKWPKLSQPLTWKFPLLKIQSKEIMSEGTMVHIRNVVFNIQNVEVT